MLNFDDLCHVAMLDGPPGKRAWMHTSPPLSPLGSSSSPLGPLLWQWQIACRWHQSPWESRRLVSWFSVGEKQMFLAPAHS